MRVRTVAIAIVLAVVVLVSPLAPTPANARTPRSEPARAVGCPRLRAILLRAVVIPGAAVYGGVLVRVAVTSPVACTMRGYPTVAAELSSHRIARSGDARDGYLPGGVTASRSPLPRISVTSRLEKVSFTVQWVGGNGPTCPHITAVRFTLPGSRVTLTVRSVHEGGVGVISWFGVYCGHLQVRPVVSGLSGAAG